jgi:hypothetical protein
MAYFEKTTANLREMREHVDAINAKGLPAAQQASAAGAQQQGKLDPHAVAEALAEAMKTKNSTTEAIAVRSTNIADQLGGKRAY